MTKKILSTADFYLALILKIMYFMPHHCVAENDSSDHSVIIDDSSGWRVQVVLQSCPIFLPTFISQLFVCGIILTSFYILRKIRNVKIRRGSCVAMGH